MSKQTMNTIAARLDRLPLSKWHNKMLWLLGLGALCDCLDMYVGGSIMAALVVLGWSNNALNGLFISVTMCGYFIGALMAGYIGDKFGRRKAFLYNVMIFSVATIGAAFAPNMTILIILRGLMGVGLGAAIPATYGSFGEYIPPQHRGRYSGYVALIANFSPPLATFGAMLIIPILGWRALFLIIGAFGFIVWFLQWKFLSESPRWLASKGFIDEADELVTKIERQIESEKGIKLEPIKEVNESEVIKSVPYSALFKGKMLRRTITISAGLIGMNIAVYTMVNWIPTIFVNSGISVSSSLGMTSVMLIGAPFGVFVCAMLANKLPRRPSAVILLLATGGIGYIYSLQRNIFMIMGVGFVMMTVLYIYAILICSVYVGEVFPTETRLRGVGFANAMGRVSSIVTPPIIAMILTNYGKTAVFATVLGLLTVIAVVIGIAGVETMGKSLEEINKDVFDA